MVWSARGNGSWALVRLWSERIGRDSFGSGVGIRIGRICRLDTGKGRNCEVRRNTNQEGEDDPKRAHLSPKRNARWFKLLYCSPALFPIYFRAARKESATYPAALQRRIALERQVSIAAHLAVLALIWTLAGGAAAARAYLLPVFFVFPIAFTLNRLGQHYDIDPTDPAKWGTLMRGHWFWDFAFLNSNYHLEHHYFAGVPFYRLPALQRALAPFYARHRMRWQNYSGLLYGWLVENRAPHTNWSRDTTNEVRDAVAPGGHVAPVDLARSNSRNSH